LGFDEYTAKLPSLMSSIAFTTAPPVMVSEFTEIPPSITAALLPLLSVNDAPGAIMAPFMYELDPPESVIADVSFGS
jgi:hypothetical protein